MSARLSLCRSRSRTCAPEPEPISSFGRGIAHLERQHFQLTGRSCHCAGLLTVELSCAAPLLDQRCHRNSSVPRALTRAVTGCGRAARPGWARRVGAARTATIARARVKSFLRATRPERDLLDPPRGRRRSNFGPGKSELATLPRAASCPSPRLRSTTRCCTRLRLRPRDAPRIPPRLIRHS